MSKRAKVTIVIVGAVVLSTVAIQASDVLRGIDGNLSGLVLESTGPCDVNATLISMGSHAVCMDIYEASPGETCNFANPQNELETVQNVQAGSCIAQSQPDVIPWRFVTLSEAQQLCARAGKRLPNNAEWYAAAVGTTEDTSCLTETNNNAPTETGTSNCVTASGIHDMIGNVWEWVDEEVQDGTYNNRTLPEEGYVAVVDSTGIVVETSNEAIEAYGLDYASTEHEGIRGMIRGGFYNSGTDAGIFALNTTVPFDFRTTGIGFRCVEDVF